MATALAEKHGANGLLKTAEYMALPDDGNRHELIHGELVLSPSPQFRHGAVLVCVAGQIRQFVHSRKLGWVGVETDMVMGKNLVLRPDLCFISKRRGSIIRGHIHGAPDLVVEITSPGNWQMDVFAKRHEYERFGVREYWALDIVESRNKAYQWCLRGKRYQGGLVTGRTINSRVIRGFKLNLEEAWEAAMP